MTTKQNNFTDAKGYHYARLLAIRGKITHGEFLQFCVMRDIAGDKLHCWKTEDQIAADMQCRRETVSRRSKKLAEVGLLRITGRQEWNRNNYYFESDYTADYNALTQPPAVKTPPAPQKPLESNPEAIAAPLGEPAKPAIQPPTPSL